MKSSMVFKRTLLSVLISSIAIPHFAFAAPLNLVQYPAGTASKQPTPKVIISVDNSGSMGSTGMTALKNALKDTFDPSNLPDGSLRLAYQAMWGCNTLPGTDSSCTKSGVSWNTMRELKGSTSTTEDSHRGQFFRWIDTLGAGGNTPTHTMMWSAGEYMKTTGVNSPWNETPGTTDASPLTCRRSYHIAMTDGGWNNYSPPANPYLSSMTAMTIKNDDGTDRVFPDGTSYSVASDETRIYRDAWGGGTTSRTVGGTTYNFNFPTLSDMAFHYWATDLQPGIANGLSPLVKKSGSETFADGGTSRTISEYWNPKNNPATWQHLTTYTIGYNNAATWPNITTNPMFNTAGGMYGGDFSRAIVGTRTWRDPITTNESGRQEELWHMAINSRGKFYPAQTSQDLKNAFLEIVGGIVADNTAPVTSFAGTSTTNTRSDFGVFKSGYQADGWTGYVRSDIVARGTGIESANPAWGIKTGQPAPKDRVTTADKLDALTDVAGRVIITTNDTTNLGAPFEWDAGVLKLSANQKTLLDADGRGEARLNFLRGDRTKEGSTVAQPFRVRLSRQGDIVNSNVWFTGSPVSNFSFKGYQTFARANKARNPMIYVGGNDGMLHGFSALSGDEKLAYVPKGVYPNLTELSKPGYSHLYYVDGSPFTGDVDVGDTVTPDWRTMLVGTLGAGGKGYFVLDVSKPGTTDSSIASNFSTTNAASLVVMDKTMHKSEVVLPASDEADIGHIFAPPVVEDTNPFKTSQIAKLNNGRWAVVMGNGYNSTNERPVLLIQYLDGDKSLKKIVASTTGDNVVQNGLSSPRLVDINGDGSPDVVYAGDLKGNLWKFDISSATPASWNVAFSGQPLYQAIYTSGGSSTRQPITAAPTVKANDRGAGGMTVAFGTGRNITEGDRTDQSKQSVYSILDNTKYKITAGKVVVDTVAATPTVVSGTTDLVQQTMLGAAIDGSGSSSGRKFWKMSQNPVPYTGAGAKKGWYLHLPETGERLLKTINFYDASNNLEVLTQIPASGGNAIEETCTPSPQEERQFRTFLNIMDGRRPGVQVMDSNGDGLFNSLDQQVSRMQTSKGAQSPVIGKDLIKVRGADGSLDTFVRLPEQPFRPSWRQMQ